MLPQPVCLLKLMQSLICMIHIQGTEGFLDGFIKYVSSFGVIILKYMCKTGFHQVFMCQFLSNSV